MGLLFLLFNAPSARAHQTPPNCTGSGLGILLYTSSPDVHVGDTLTYGITVFNGTGVGPVVCDAEGIRAFVVTPDGITNAVPLVRTNLSNGQGDYYPNAATYVVRSQDIRPDGTVRATANDTGVVHQNDTDSQGGGFQGVNTEVSLPCIQITAQCVGSVGENGAITFSGTVTNCGNNMLTGVTVTNSVNGGQFLVTVIGNLATNQGATFSGSWIPANPCSSSTATLTARGSDSQTSSPRVVSSSANTTCSEVLTAGILVAKSCPVQPVAPGQLLTFTGSVSNTGNVTLTNIIVVNSQPSPNTPVFTLASLAPGAVANFSGSYLAPTNCSVADTLNATATSRCGVNVSSAASATCPILTTPQIAVTVLCPVIPAVSGGTLTYSGTVRNSGDVTLNNIVVVSDRPVANTTVFSVASLTPGASANFTSSLTVPANSCSVTTTFSGRGQNNCNATLVTNTVSPTCPITTAPAIAVTLVCPGTSSSPGGSITYTGTVRNSGNVTLNNVFVVNNQPTANTPVIGPFTLAPGVTTNFITTFTTPVDTCSVSSTVTAEGSDNCTQALVNNSATATCTLLTTPRFVLTQTCPTNVTGLGGVLTYSGSISNTGNITLTNVSIVNNLSGATPVFTVATLAPGSLTNFTGSYSVPVNSGCAIASTLTATARDKCTGTQITTNSTATCPVQGAADIAVRLACPGTPTPLGGVLTFSGSVSNSGNVTLTNVFVNRNTPAPTTTVFSIASLAPGISANFTGSYTVPASNACSITTSVSVSGNEQCAGLGVGASVSIDCPLVTTALISVRQTCPVSPGTPGSLVIYGGSVSNAGNIILTNIKVVSSQPAPNTVVFSLGSLAPGATAGFNSSFVAPLDACSASSTLTATGLNLCNNNAVSNSVTTTCPLVTTPQISVTKACPLTPAVEGGLLVFTGTVTNTGNITLTNIFVVNSRPTPNTAVFGPVTLPPGAGTNFSGSYTAPLNTCFVSDTLTATGRDKCTGTTVSNLVSATCPITTIPRINVTLVCPVAPALPGSSVTYTGAVSNPGNVTLNNVVVFNTQFETTILTVPSLAPGASTNFSTSFNAPVDACSISSTVTASGNDACSSRLVSTNASATCTLVTTPRIVVTENCPVNPASPGGLLIYSGTVSNAGNITLTNVLVTNDRSGATTIFALGTLAPGAIAGFSGSYLVPANSGCTVTSTLTGAGSDKCTGNRVSASASSTCPLLTTPLITVTQTCPVTQVAPGGILTYSGTVSNAGNITLTNIIVLNNQPASNTVVFTLATLVPGATANFSGSYQVPTNCCVVSSTLRASGQGCAGVTVTDTATRTCTVLTLPNIVVTKVCTPGIWRAGDLLTYSGIVSNSGNITLINVTVVNNQAPNSPPVPGPLTLAPGEFATYTASYTVPPDFCGGDTVTASGLDVCTFVPVANSVTTACSITTAPRITVTKNCPLLPTPRGGLYVYTGSVGNPGNVTLINVFVVDNQPSNNTPVIGPITLAPGAIVNFTNSYIAPRCCCFVIDTLTARGQDRCSASNVTATATTVCPLLTTPGISISEVCPGTTVPVGGLYVFTGMVTNTGDVVLTNVVVFSNQPNTNALLLGPIELAPGESHGFMGSYTVTAGNDPTTNTVTARGTDDCQGRPVSARADCSGPVGTNVPPRITSVTTSNAVVTIVWTSTFGSTYTLQSDGSLTNPWMDVPGDVTAMGPTASKQDAMGTNRSRFYRVLKH